MIVPVNIRRATRKAAFRIANATAQASRVLAAMATGERELHTRLTQVAGRVRDAMVADGHAVTSNALPILVTGGRCEQDPEGTMGLCHGGKITVFRSAFALAGGIQRRILVHELVHHFDVRMLGEAYATPESGHSAYAAQRCETLARSYETRAGEFFT